MSFKSPTRHKFTDPPTRAHHSLKLLILISTKIWTSKKPVKPQKCTKIPKITFNPATGRKWVLLLWKDQNCGWCLALMPLTITHYTHRRFNGPQVTCGLKCVFRSFLRSLSRPLYLGEVLSKHFFNIFWGSVRQLDRQEDSKKDIHAPFSLFWPEIWKKWCPLDLLCILSNFQLNFHWC